MPALRILALGVMVVVVAMAAPKYAPGLVAMFVDTRAPERPVVSRAPAAPAPRVAAKPPRETKRAARREPSLNRGRVILEADRRGHFVVEAWVNGRSIPAMVDTGATAIALNAETARAIGIRPPRSAFKTPISTANGVVAAAKVTLREVRIGGIRVRNVDALVVPEGLLGINLLGMNFLGRLSKFEISGPRLVLVR